MRKFKFFIDFDKEEKWLEEMAKQGWLLISCTFGYYFRKIPPEDVVIKIDYRKFNNQEDFLDYCTLFEDSGWKHIAGSKNSGTQYFRKMEQNNTKHIFSDKISNAAKYKRLSQMFIQLGICFLPIFAALVATDVINSAAFFNPKLLYLTHGLWEMSGVWTINLLCSPGYAVIQLLLIFPLRKSLQEKQILLMRL